MTEEKQREREKQREKEKVITPGAGWARMKRPAARTGKGAEEKKNERKVGKGRRSSGLEPIRDLCPFR